MNNLSGFDEWFGTRDWRDNIQHGFAIPTESATGTELDGDTVINSRTVFWQMFDTEAPPPPPHFDYCGCVACVKWQKWLNR